MIWIMLKAILLLTLIVGVACGGSDVQMDTAMESIFEGRALYEPPSPSNLEEIHRSVRSEIPAKSVNPEAPMNVSGSRTLGASDVLSGSFVNDDVVFEASMVSQERLIVRNVNMTMVVENISASLDKITSLSQEIGGRFVSSDHSIKHLAFIAIRVPANQLDAAVQRLRQMAVEIKSEVADSLDVTDEYVDLRAQLDNLHVAEAAYIKLFDRAKDVEDALEIQKTLTKVQEDIERLEGRIKLLEETAAFSLIGITLELNPAEMEVDAGEDKTTGVHEISRFRASFKPPSGFENYVFTWDFGDGSHPISSDRTAPTQDPDTRVTATVTYVYTDERDSPYFAEIKMIGTGDAGVVEGEDTILVNVTRRPVIEVFAGKSIITEEGKDVELTGSFTRPDGLFDVSYRWDFGDGTAPATGSLEGGVTNAVAIHAYSDHRPFPYTATLIVKAQSDAGSVESSGFVNIEVHEPAGWVVSGWSIGEHGKMAVRALSAVGQGVATVLIWIVILLPIWVVVGSIGVVIFKRSRKRD